MATLTTDLQRCVRAFIGFVLACCCCCTLGNPIRRDVPDGVVYTDLHKTVELGSRVVLKCEFHGPPLGVYWKKGDNPSTAPSLITLVEGEPDSGSCVKDKTCEMGDDFSLIIKNVSIADQGRYICRISNYKGILLHNTTDVRVYASPEEPYPIIKECKEKQGQNCSFPSLARMNITCTSSRYFPHIDLFFLHGSQKFTTLETWESTNADGTKNKSIFTIAPPSKKPYVCVAFNIPGFHDQRTATVSFPGHSATNNTDSPDENDGPSQMQIVVPLAFCGGALLLGVLVASCWICFFKRGRNHNRTHGHDGTDEETTPLFQGKISLYELWSLARSMIKYAKEVKLRDTLKELDITDIKEGPVGEVDVYKALCKWRDGIRPRDQAKIMEKALKKFHLDAVWEELTDEKEKNNINIPQEILEHILWSIADVNKVHQFLHKLNPNRTASNTSDDMKFVVESALRELREWTKKSFPMNPFVLLSLALEEAECKYIDQLLFSIPSELKLPIQKEKLEKFINELTGRHCRRLAIHSKCSSKDTDEIVLGNNFFLFDTRSMMSDWLNEEECSNYEKRCRLDDAIIEICRYDLQDFWKTIEHRRNTEGYIPEGPFLKSYYFDHECIFDDDIPQLVKLVKCLPPDKKAQFNKKMGLNPDENADDDDTINDQMKKWRDSLTITSSSKVSKDEALREFQSFREFLTNSTTYRESAGNKRSTKNIAEKELRHIALRLLMEDVRPIMKVLGIDQGKVSKYVRQDGKGWSTTYLLRKLLKSVGDRGNRDNLCKALRNIGFVDVARSVYFGENAE